MAHNSYHMEDEALERALDRSLLRRLFAYLRPFWGLAVVVLALSVASSVLYAGRILFVGRAVDEAMQTKDLDALLLWTGLFFGVEIFRWGVRVGLQYLTARLGQSVVLGLRMEVFSKLQQLSLRYFDRNPAGRLITRVTNDVESLNELFSAGLVTIFHDLFLLAALVAMMLWVQWQLGLLCLVILPVLAVASVVLRRKIRRAIRLVRKRLAMVNAFLQEHFLGMRVTQMFHQEARKTGEFDEVNHGYRDQMYRAIKIHAVIRPLVTLILAVGTGLLFVYSGERSIAGDSTLTAGMFIMFLLWFRMFQQPIQNIADKYNIIQTAMASSERLFKLLDEEDAVPQRPGARVVDGLKGRIEFRNVSFEYNPGEPVLKDVSFAMEPGEMVAFVGATGAGKSTIVNLIFRFYDVTSGQVLVDGVDVRDYDKESLRSQMSLVLQDVFVFSGPVTRNIRLGSAIPIERVRGSARMVNAHRFIEALPDGYETVLSERGSTLSSGQRQLLSFARALAFDPSILVLDEATSNVDTETERLIQEAVETLTQGRTSIVVAHRLSTIQKADKIIVLHRGEVREVGTHQELLRERGLYYRLYQLQYKEQQLAEPPSEPEADAAPEA